MADVVWQALLAGALAGAVVVLVSLAIERLGATLGGGASRLIRPEDEEEIEQRLNAIL